jgi:NRPS condensation-like uncharacterized protein
MADLRRSSENLTNCNRSKEFLMERYLGSFEHSSWLYNQFCPMDFATVAKLQGQFSVDRLSKVLEQVQQRHPLLRVRIATDALGQPKFVETDAEIPLRLVARTDDSLSERLRQRQWQTELEVELARSLDWQVAPLLRVVLLQSGDESELMIICHHTIADGRSGIYLMRDLLQGLCGQTFERSELADAISLESALPGIALSPVATPKPKDYVPPQSRPPRPHIRSVVLSPELTQQTIQRSRAERTTVHGAIGAAFSIAFAQQDVNSDVLRCMHPVDVRSQLSLPIPEGVGLYICLCMTSHSLQADAAFWDVARAVKFQLSQIDIAQHLVEEVQLRQPAMANLTDATAFAEASRVQFPCQLHVTNLGRIDLAQQYGNIRIEAIHAPVVMPSALGRIVGVATLGDRLALTISSTPLMNMDRNQSDRAASAFLSEGVKHLELAVVQQVSA